MAEPSSPRVAPKTPWAAYEYCPSTPERPSAGRLSGAKRSPQPEVFSDRLVPSRAGTDLETGFGLLDDLENSPWPNRGSAAASSSSGAGPGVSGPGASPPRGSDENGAAYERLLRTELLGSPAPKNADVRLDDAVPRTPEPRKSLFKYRSTPEPAAEDHALSGTPPVLRRSGGLFDAPPCKPARKVAPEPFKVLHAPCLEDDFYLNILDCSCGDVIAVGMGGCVDLWNIHSGRANRLCELGDRYGVTSVAWSPTGEHLALGRHDGEVQLWDVAMSKRLRTFGGHCRRVAALVWNGSALSTGGRDKDILHRDVRGPAPFSARLQGHSQEVCGLKWSHDGQQLASGGNDCAVCVWSPLRSTAPEHRFTEHEAAVKALAWSPHQRGVLASGGGTCDKCIRFWNTLSGTATSCLPTGSQVCNLAWSRNVDELVSTHGYSGNEIVVWRYPSLSRVATLQGHKSRVLYLAIMADGQSVITGAGDETIRFWNVFPRGKPRTSAGQARATPLSLSRTIR